MFHLPKPFSFPGGGGALRGDQPAGEQPWGHFPLSIPRTETLPTNPSKKARRLISKKSQQ